MDRICRRVFRTVEDAADLDAWMVAGHATRGARHRGRGVTSAVTLMVVAAIAAAVTATTMVLAHTASARPASGLFVTPTTTASQYATDGPSTGVVMPPGTDDQAGAVRSQEPDPSHHDQDRAEEPNAGGSDLLNDGLSEDPGQPRQPAGSANPTSNG
jgi:hypothetical protein